MTSTSTGEFAVVDTDSEDVMVETTLDDAAENDTDRNGDPVSSMEVEGMEETTITPRFKGEDKIRNLFLVVLAIVTVSIFVIGVNRSNGTNGEKNKNVQPTFPADTFEKWLADQDYNTTSFELSTNGAIGTIPTEIGLYTSLTDLSVEGEVIEGTLQNKLSGTIPTEVGFLTALKKLSFGFNRLTGTIPTELGLLTAVTSFTLNRNGLAGTIPTELGNLTALVDFRLQENELTGTIPSEFGDLYILQTFFLYQNHLEGTVPMELSHLGRIETLWLYGNDLTGSLDPVFCDKGAIHTSIFWFQADCSGNPPEVSCGCCTHCCQDTPDGSGDACGGFSSCTSNVDDNA